MLYSLILIIVVAVLIFIANNVSKLQSSERKRVMQRYGLWVLAFVLLVLVISGRAHWLMGVVAALLALLGRIAEFARYIPLLSRFFGDNSQKGPYKNTVVSNNMTVKQAAEILGVDEAATVEEINLAHKRLMQKVHPDRGGSDALAAQINEARTVLLSDRQV